MQGQNYPPPSKPSEYGISAPSGENKQETSSEFKVPVYQPGWKERQNQNRHTYPLNYKPT